MAVGLLAINREFLITHLTLFMTQGPFSVYLVLARGSVDHIAPIVLVVLRFLGGTITLHLFQYFVYRKFVWTAWRELHPHMRRDVLFAGVLAALSPITFIYGLMYTTAVVAAAIDASCPAIAIVVALVMRTEKLTKAHMICLIMSILGNTFVLELWDTPVQSTHASSEKTAAAHVKTLIGVTLVFVSCLLGVINYNIQKPILRAIGTADLVTYIASVALLIVFAASCYDLGAFSVLTHHQPGITWFMIGYAVCFQGWSHALFTALALRRATPVMLSMYTTLVPAIGSGLAYMLLGEEVNVHQLIGIVLVVLSVVVAALANEKVKDDEDAQKKELV